MQEPDDVSERHPLGEPVRSEAAPKDNEGTWRALDPDKPYIETNSVTGRMRNTRPPPLPQGVPIWPFNMPVAKP